MVHPGGASGTNTHRQCVFQVDREKGTLTLTEIAPGVTVEEVESKTDATFEVASDLKSME